MMKNYFKLSLFFASLLFIGANLFAVPAYPDLISFVQPDGSKVNIYLKGDEYVKWGKSEDGYTLMYNDDGFFVFAQYNPSGDMVPSEHIAKNIGERDVSTNLFLRNLPKDIFYSDEQMSMLMQIRSIRNAENSMQQSYPTSGNRKLLCILIGYTDKEFTKTQSEFNNLFNQVGYSTGGATGSVKDYYLENSYGQFNLTVDVTGPYTASREMAYYGGNDSGDDDLRPRELVREAVLLADPDVNYDDYDNDNDGYVDAIYVIYAGYGEEAGGGANAIWAHQWALSSPVQCDGKYIQKYSCSSELRGSSGSDITRIGVICHEFGHVLGAPDYYDTDYSTGGSYEGMGDWCIMASGSWNNNGATPAHHNGFTKVEIYNWATATTLSSATNVVLHNAAENSNSFYKFNTTTNNEYYFIENRHKHLFDAAIPGSGMMIYHVHKDILSAAQYNNVNNTHPQKMYPVSQNATSNPSSSPSSYGTINSSSCAWTGTGKTSFTDTSTPNAKSWAGANTNKPITDITHNTTAKTVSFCFINCVTECTQPTQQASNVNVTNIQDNQLRLNWTRGNGNGVLVLAKKSSAVDADPMQGITYTANANFGSGNEVGSGNFVVYKGTGSNVTITGLTPGTNYHFSVYEYRTTGTCYKIPSANANATTTGTAPCEYCYSYGSTQYGTSITGVSFNTINKTSGKETDGNGNAYSDYTNISTELTKGSSYELSVRINTDGGYRTATKVWIDWNGNCVFDENEGYDLGLAINVTNGLTENSPLTITVPENAVAGATTMRVSVQYTGSSYTPPTACQQNLDGEVEDYTVNILEPISCTEPTVQASNITPSNIGDNQLRLNWTRGNGNQIMVLAREGSAINTEPIQGISYDANSQFGSGEMIDDAYVVYKGTGTNVNITSLLPGSTYHFALYEFFTEDNCYKNPAATANATTTGTVPCDYCYAYGHTQYGTSITGVSFNTINKISGKETDGNGNAYSDYTNVSTDVMKGLTYPLSVKTDSDGNYYTKTNVWIDWNGNCEFDEDEIYEFGYTLNSSDTDVDGSPRNITIPENAITGPTRMRVTVKYINTSNIVDPTPCNQNIDGEVEDYTVNILDEPTCTPPTTQAQNLSVTNIQDNQMRLNWTRGNGTSVLVVAKKSSAVDVDPYQSLSYNANSSFGLGDDLGSGCIVVYKGTGTNVTITSLHPGTTYHFAVYEFFINDNCYKRPAAVYSATTTGSALCSYCYSYGSTAIGASITGVTLNTIDKISEKETDANGNAYSDYTYLSTELTRGESHQLTVKLNAGGNYNNAAKVWIDWNGNCEFEDSEGYDLGSAPTAISGTTSNSPLTITVPADAVLGYTRMRVSMMYNNPNDNIPPTQCQEDIYGEVEDYSIFIKSSCEPVVVTTQAVEYQELCRLDVTNLSVEAEGAGPIIYQWQYLLGETWYNVTNNYPTGATYSNAQTQNLSISGITAIGTHSYRVIVSNCNGEYIVESDIANIVVVSTPARPGIISGSTTVCQGDENIDYSVTNVNGITYTWSYSGTGVSFTGQGTNSIAVNYSQDATSGTWTVVPTNTCGDGQSRTRSVTVNPLPNQTSNINGATAVCAGETNISYSVTNVSGITYEWTYSGAGAAITGQGTNNISVNYSPTATSGTWTVVPSNSCGNGVPTTLDVDMSSAPQTPVAISVQSVVCQGEEDVLYSVEEEEDVNYIWSYSGAGATFNGQGTSSISVDFSTSAISGTLTVLPSNSCGNGSALNMSIAVKELPVQASVITGETSICPGTNGIEYSVASIPGTAYNWSYSGEGANIFGQGTNSIAINFAPTATSGLLSVHTANSCGSSTPRTLNINVLIPQTPLFDNFGPYCHNEIADLLPTSSNNGISGTWNPENISTSTTGNHSYIFTPSAEHCANTVEITVETTEKATPQFNITTSYCPNAMPDALPNYSIDGIGGLWSPSAINTSIMGSTTYTFTPNDGECANEVQITVEVGDDIVPQFEDFGPYCHNGMADILPETSLNGIPGTWSPSVISTTSVGEESYVFTPDANQCATTTQITIEVQEKQNPNFVLGPICHNDDNFILPNISTNGISGVWTPATVNTEVVGTQSYTFTPNESECANAVEVEITVEELQIPTFADFGPYCQFENLESLPLISENGITGVWTPATVNTDDAGTYQFTFVPEAECSQDVEIDITVKPTPETPIITQNGFQLISDANDGNQWYHDESAIDGATNSTYDASQDGEYYTIVGLDGCFSDPSNLIVVTGTAIGENIVCGINIYPNPFEEKLIIEFPPNIEDAKIQIYNTLGQILYSEQAHQRALVNTQDFATGVYFIKIENKEMSEIVKMIKK